MFFALSIFVEESLAEGPFHFFSANLEFCIYLKWRQRHGLIYIFLMFLHSPIIVFIVV